jgi:hypothetical protein
LGKEEKFLTGIRKLESRKMGKVRFVLSVFEGWETGNWNEDKCEMNS